MWWKRRSKQESEKRYKDFLDLSPREQSVRLFDLALSEIKREGQRKYIEHCRIMVVPEELIQGSIIVNDHFQQCMNYITARNEAFQINERINEDCARIIRIRDRVSRRERSIKRQRFRSSYYA